MRRGLYAKDGDSREACGGGRGGNGDGGDRGKNGNGAHNGVASKINSTRKLNHVQHAVQHATRRRRLTHTHLHIHTRKCARVERLWCIVIITIIIMFCTNSRRFRFSLRAISHSAFDTTPPAWLSLLSQSGSLQRAFLHIRHFCLLRSLRISFVFKRLFPFVFVPRPTTDVLMPRRAYCSGGARFFFFCTT